MKRLLFLGLSLQLSLTQAETLVVGTTPQNPPFSMLADSKQNFYGFDVDLMNTICERIKADCKFKPFAFNNLFGNVQEKKIDLAIAAIVIMPMWQDQFLFSLPYLESDAQFVTLQTSKINHPQDILHKRIGVRLGTPFSKLASSIYGSEVTVMTYPEIDDLIEALSHNKIDAILTNAAAAKFWYANDSATYKLVGSQIPTGQGYGIMTNLNQKELIVRINKALLSMEADGTYLDIYNRYFQ